MGPTDALLLPSLAVMVTVADVPTALSAGVPLSLPVLSLKVAQDGCPVIEKVTEPPD
jgi:hypothetical protein